VHGADPVPDHPDSVIFPADHGKATVFLGKEALLARLTDLRSTRHQEVIDRFFELSRDQAFYYTNVYVLAEVFTSVRYGTSAREAAQLQADIEDSAIRVLHGSDDWSSTNLSNTPKEVFLAATQLYEEREKIAFNITEATLVLEAARAEASFVFTYDGTIATLARSFGLDVLPYSMPHRSTG
jgi:hypothetical protein